MRRLLHGKETRTEEYGWKPFGNVDYGYGELYQSASSWTIWALVTYGSFSISPIEAAAILGGAVLYSESIDYDTKPHYFGTGASWVHNVQAGYCWYHYFVKGRKEWPVWLGTWAEMAGDIGAVAEEKLRGDIVLYNHKAHYQGASIGMAAAFLFDLINKKKGSQTSLWWKSIPLLALSAMYYQQWHGRG